jgi:GH15 family glucan-1,4-alpha-glucosidase
MRDLNLAVIGNCVVAALLDRKARVVWLCHPRLDGDPVFCELLNGEGPEDGRGVFEIVLEGFAASAQHYAGNTAILVTTLTDATGGQARITDFFPRYKHFGRISRPAMLVRRVEPVAGRPRIRVRVRPVFQYGAREPAVAAGSNNIRYQSPDAVLRLTTDAPPSYVAAEAPFALSAPVHFLLGPDETVPEAIPGLVRDLHDRTEEYWSEWARYLSVPFEWQDAVIRAAIALKLCSFEETGAIVAALTTSIPEAPDSGRNWDYRYCWLRDAYFTVQALNRLGATRTMEEFIAYITNVAAMEEDGRLRPVYGIVPGSSLEERVIDGLKGYRGMAPVRVGNAAEGQDQHDAYGSVVLAAAQMFFDHRLPRRGDLELFRLLEGLGETAFRLALEPDSGPWELRGRRRVHAFSSVMCWAACRTLARIADRLEREEAGRKWRGAAKKLRAAILERLWNPHLNSFVSSAGGSDVDASLLLLPQVGFVAAGDLRFRGTLDLVERRLRRGNHILRYADADDFGVPSTAFTVCTFWYIDALAAVGRREEARELFRHTLSLRNSAGLLSEDVDPASGELWGNFPQAYSMVGLVFSAMRLSKSWEEAFWRGS